MDAGKYTLIGDEQINIFEAMPELPHHADGDLLHHNFPQFESGSFPARIPGH
jgi:hypothetical protein